MTIVTSTTKSADLPTALPFDGHLTRTAAARRPNFLKEQYKYNSIPGVTRMAEGKSVWVQTYQTICTDPQAHRASSTCLTPT
jgi:hypothetical protein